MVAQILDGKAVAETVRARLQSVVETHIQMGRRPPRIDVIRVGEDPASEIYVRNKEKAAKSIGMLGVQHHLPSDASRGQVLDLIERLNNDVSVDAVLLQLPLSQHLSESEMIAAIRPEKDVDGFHRETLGRLVRGEDCVHACTPAGVMELIGHTGISIQGLNAIVVGRSNIVGKPLALLLLAADATVTVAHSRTRNLAGYVGEADIVVAAVGRPELVKGAWIKPGAIVIDVGINRKVDGGMVGDVEFEAARQRASWITPVPGGVGPMTIAMLLANTLHLYEAKLGPK